MDRLARALGYYTSEDLRAAEQRARQAAQAAFQQLNEMRGAHDLDADAKLQDDAPEEPELPLPAGHLKYFVSYAFSAGRGTGFGACEVSSSHPIRSSKDTDAIRDALLRRFAGEPGPKATIVIMNWRRYEDPEPPVGGREDFPADDESPVILRLVA